METEKSSRANLSRQLIQQQRQHVLSDVPLELFHSSKVFLTGRTSRLNDFVFLAHKRGEIMSVNFVLYCTEQLRFFDSAPLCRMAYHFC
jgi:hypothetical protein